jgi:hypothetical protein
MQARNQRRELPDLVAERTTDDIELLPDLGLDALQIGGEGCQTLIDALEMLLRVEDEGLEIPQDLLLVVGEALLRILRHIHLDELV